MTLNHPQLYALSLIVLVGGCGQRDAANQYVRKTIDPDSIQVVENGTLPRQWDEELSILKFEDEWTLGADPSRDETIFRFLSPELLAEGKDQQVGVLNTSPPELRVFDKEGLFLWKAGREGEGPGEFRYPQGLVYEQSLGWVISEGSKKIVFDEQGAYRNTINLDQLPFGQTSRDFTLGEQGSFWYLGLRSRREGSGRFTSFHLIAGEFGGMTATELYSFAQPALSSEEGRMFVLEDWPMVFCTDVHNRAWVVGDLPYQIEVIPHSGQDYFRIRRQHELHEYDPTYKKGIESGWKRYSSEPIIWPRLPDKMPAIQNISRGPDSEMWVFTRAWVDSPMVQVDVFNENGVYTHAFLADVALAGFPFSSSHVYRTDKAEDGAPLLIRSRYFTVRP